MISKPTTDVDTAFLYLYTNTSSLRKSCCLKEKYLLWPAILYQRCCSCNRFSLRRFTTARRRSDKVREVIFIETGYYRKIFAKSYDYLIASTIQDDCESTDKSGGLHQSLLQSSRTNPTETFDQWKKDIGKDEKEQLSVPWDNMTSEVQDLSYYETQRVFNRRKVKLLKESFTECGRITSHFAKTFYLGTLLMSPQKQEAVWAIYVWCRRTDDLVDGPRAQQRRNQLEQILRDWRNRLETVFSGKAYDALDLALYETKLRFPKLNIQPFYDMINGMQMDVEQNRYQTFEELRLYCYRVAGTVGLMTLAVMGVVNPDPHTYQAAEEAAVCLGIAFQLTNILRDVGEDSLRGRIYLPLEDLAHFDYSEGELMAGVVDERYKNLMRFEISRARHYFSKAEHGIRLLSRDVQLPVRASLDMYRSILNVIEENNYDNFHRRAYVGKWRKLSMLPLSWLLCQEGRPWIWLKEILQQNLNMQEE
eukprot:jgi/Galph1/2087/GphlegSOOS_G748.1